MMAVFVNAPDTKDEKMKRKSNSGINFVKDTEKSYVYINDEDKEIGILMWHYKKKKWVFEGM